MAPNERFSLRTQSMSPAQARDAEIDVCLREYMLRVYNYMASGLALTGAVAYSMTLSETAMQLIFGTPLFWVVALAPLGFVFYLSSA